MIEIYGTLGPSCEKQEILEAMLAEGMTGIRLNLSHVSLRESSSYLADYRAACSAAGKTMELMIDLHGPELRTGRMERPVTLEKGNLVLLCSEKAGKTSYPQVPVPQAILDNLEKGDRIILHDGGMLLEAAEEPGQSEASVRSEKSFLCRAVTDGLLEGHQSVKIEGKEIFGNVMTAMDLENLGLARRAGVTSVMQPFVRCARDICLVREAIRQQGLDLRIFAKIESSEGLDRLDEIMAEADVIVIARGDLGNAVPLWELPRIQKEIASRCKAAGKPFLTVTQMLDSMIDRPVPTRAEVTDIFNAVLDGSSGVMVTGETAVGRYPVEVIRYLTKTVREAERYLKGD